MKGWTFLCAAPVASYGLGINGGASGGAMVTITGTNFGLCGFTATAVPVAASVDKGFGSTSWSSATSVVCTLGAVSSPTTSYPKVTVNAMVGTRATKPFTFDGASINTTAFVSWVELCVNWAGMGWWLVCAAPVFSTLQPKNTIGSGDESVTISGLNFGAYSFTPTVAHSGEILCGTASWTSGTSVACLLAVVTSNPDALLVMVSTVAGTRLRPFSFDGPLASSIVNRNGPTSLSGTVTISGLNFGQISETVTAELEQGMACSTSAWTSSTAVQVHAFLPFASKTPLTPYNCSARWRCGRVLFTH